MHVEDIVGLFKKSINIILTGNTVTSLLEKAAKFASRQEIALAV
tara:strand:- start:142 stop:273 length:132 start_codon:yes stop_codon:yes gene_type:complete